MALLVQLRGTCDQGNVCPTLHYQPDSDEFVVQGYAVTDAQVRAGLKLPAGKDVVRVPTALLPELQFGPDAAELLVQGDGVNDVELLSELNLPPGESAIRIPAYLLPKLGKEPQRC
jgi:hypothetical protein